MTTHQPIQPASKSRFAFIDGLRAIAALWVVLFHINPRENLESFSQIMPNWFIIIFFDSGALGVPIFFVISGFVSAYSLRNTRLSWSLFKQLNLRRFIRLSPTYYASVIVVIGLALLASQVKGEPLQLMNEPFSVPRLVAHLFYLQEILGFANFNDVYWTLSLEVQFHLLLLGLLFLSQVLESKNKLAEGSKLIFFAAIGLSMLYPLSIMSSGDDRPVWIFPSLYMFLLGSLAYWAAVSKTKSVELSLFVLLVSLLTSIAFYNHSPSLFTTATIAALLTLALRFEQMQNWLNYRWLQFIGKISYSLFLIHTPFLGAAFFICYRFLGTGSLLIDLTGMALGTGISLISAWGLWSLVENPSIQLVRKINLSKSSKPISL